MPRALKTPRFESEAEEAKWWADNQDALLHALKEANKDGTLGRSTSKR